MRLYRLNYAVDYAPAGANPPYQIHFLIVQHNARDHTVDYAPVGANPPYNSELS
jgi:hypothetical protein